MQQYNYVEREVFIAWNDDADVVADIGAEEALRLLALHYGGMRQNTMRLILQVPRPVFPDDPALAQIPPVRAEFTMTLPVRGTDQCSGAE